MVVSTHYLGIDAGNSKTIAAICDSTGTISGWGRAGVGDIYAAPGEQEAVKQVELALEQALDQAGIGLGDVTHAALRLAGVDWPDDELHWRGVLADRMSLLPSASVKNDGFSLLRFASDSGVGLSIVSGTGPALAARGHDGAEFNASWWIRDLLGALGLGEAAFTAVVKAELGMAASTRLRSMLLDLHGVDDVEHLLERFTRRVDPLPRERHSAAARLVLRAAADGDEVAIGIVDSHALKLAEYAVATARRVGFDPAAEEIAIALGGGVLQAADTGYSSRVIAALHDAMPHARLHPVVASPILGALVDALAESGIAPTDDLRDRLALGEHADPTPAS